MRRIDGELLTHNQQKSRFFRCSCYTHELHNYGSNCVRWVEGSGGFWERFAILPNIEGQKYTFGEVFEGREKQGEFIFFERIESSGSRRSKRFCEITIVKNKYWIGPFGKNKVWINGVQIKERTKLNFGDFLRLGEIVECNDVDHTPGFWFKERELDPNAFEDLNSREYSTLRQRKEDNDVVATLPKNKKLDPNVEFTPQQNELVFSHIFSYLAVRHLKKARLVSKLWNKEAVRILRKRCVVKFNLYGYEAINASMRFFRYDLEMKNNPMPNWYIRLGPRLVRPSKGKLDAKLDQDLDWTLRKGHVVKWLMLEANICAECDYDRNIKILEYVQETIQDLNLHWTLKSVKASEKDYGRLAAIRFNKLHTFTLSLITWGGWHGSDHRPGDHHSFAVLRPLLEAIKGVKTIRLKSEPVMIASFLKYMKESSPFPNLVGIEISLLYAKPNDFKFIIELDLPVTKLELHQYPDSDSDHDFVPLLERLLLKHSNTLEYLQFVIPSSSNFSSMNLPVFPKLKYLNIGFGTPKYDDDGEEQEPKKITLKFQNPSYNDIIDYGRHFPSLESLSVWPVGYLRCGKRDDNIKLEDDIDVEKLWEKHGFFFELFFPTLQENESPRRICKTLKYLDIPYESEYIEGRHPQRLFPRALEISAMFPNVFNMFMNKVRKPSWKRTHPPRTGMKLRSSSRQMKTNYNIFDSGRNIFAMD